MFLRNQHEAMEAKVILLFRSAEAQIRFAPKEGVAIHSLGMAHGYPESIHEIPFRFECPQPLGPGPMQKGFDVTELGQLPDEGRTVAQMGKPCGPMPAEVRPNVLVAAVAEDGADERRRQGLSIRPSQHPAILAGTLACAGSRPERPGSEPRKPGNC